ncbi:MAG: ABC transporter substrate-binding protein [Gammaproteobacteria bacterium]|nr:ABC transporter substrate-binding protein [Gammaproteobacteria bacterium]
MRVKTFLIILIASCFVVACSKNETPQSSPAAENVPMTITPIKVGVIFDKTTLPHYMSRSENSIKLATEDLNNAGGLLGRPVKLIIRDSRGQPSDALQVVQELYSSHNIDVLLSHTSTRVSLVLSDFLNGKNYRFLRCGVPMMIAPGKIIILIFLR